MLIEPTLLLDKTKCLANISAMAEKALKNNLIFRPHFKTHQSHEVGRWFREFGVTKITASSLKMAEYFANDDWKDITVAFPLNVHETDRIKKLAEKITLNLLIVSPDNVARLGSEVKLSINIFIEVDLGYHRTGVSPDDTKTIDAILGQLKKYKQLHFAGFLGHAGHSYKAAGNKKKILSIHKASTDIMVSLKKKYKKQYPDMIVSIGDTPTCTVAESFEGIDEIRPGNMVFYDAVQHQIGSVTLDLVAVAMACPIVAKYPKQKEVVVYGGAVHFSKDFMTLPNGKLTYGKVVPLTENGWSTEETGMYVKGLSQEHGIIHAEKDKIEKLKIGDFIGILPIHSCLTADVMKSYLTLEGKRITMMQ